MLRSKRRAAERAFLARVGAELRRLREKEGLTQEAVGEVFKWQRAAIHKVESGQNALSLYHYLHLMQFYVRVAPNHPAHALSDRLLPHSKGRIIDG